MAADLTDPIVGELYLPGPSDPRTRFKKRACCRKQEAQLKEWDDSFDEFTDEQAEIVNRASEKASRIMRRALDEAYALAE